MKTRFHLVTFHDHKSKIMELKSTYPGPPGWSSISTGYDTEEQLRSSIEPLPCSSCGALYEAKYNDKVNAKLREANTCFYCDFWLGYIDYPKGIRIKGHHYVASPDNGGGRFSGHGGRQFTIRMNDGTEIVTKNLWSQGVIPMGFRERIPDNAEFVKTPEPVGHGQGFLR